VRYIPEHFKLGPHTMHVIMDGDLVNDSEAYGMAEIGKQLITIQTQFDGFTAASQRQTFIHELVHMILDVMGETELSCNERFVEGFSQLLLQYMKTRRGNADL